MYNYFKASEKNVFQYFVLIGYAFCVIFTFQILFYFLSIRHLQFASDSLVVIKIDEGSQVASYSCKKAKRWCLLRLCFV